MDIMYKVYARMEEIGLDFVGSIDWSLHDKWQRFKCRSKSHGKPIFVIVSQHYVSFGDWRNPSHIQTVWNKPYDTFTTQQKIEYKRNRDKIELEKQQNKLYAQKRAQLLLQKSHEASLEHPYVIRKRIVPYYANQIRSYLIIPIYDLDGNLLSLQYINRHGFKRFKSGASVKCGYAFLGECINDDDVLHICEGWATGCSIYEAIGGPVICAMQASNLAFIARSFRGLYPTIPINICADNDAHLKDNVGVKAGMEAADTSDSTLIIPDFSKFANSYKLTDFNDLAIIAGIEEVENQLLKITTKL